MKQLEKKKVIIFDFDETIITLDVRWRDLTREITKIIKEKYDIEISYMHPLSIVMDEIYRKAGKNAVKDYLPLQTKYESENIQNTKPHKKVIEFIRNNKDRFAFAIWSGNTLETIQKVLDMFGITDCFSVIVCRSDLAEIKPAKEGFLKIQKALGYERREYIMIGNAEREDFGASVNAGIEFMYAHEFEELLQD